MASDNAKKKRLQQCFSHANTQAAQSNFDYATEMFTQCVVGAPENVSIHCPCGRAVS